jgi:3-hydroxyacyl-CoA dehydrogenase
LFFAEKSATKIPGVDSKTPTRDVSSVAIIGSGTMGGGIAMNVMNAGIRVIMLDLNPKALKFWIGVVRKNYEVSAKKGRLTNEQVEQRMRLLADTTQYSALSDVNLVIEAVFEKMEVKYEVFKMLDKVCKPGCILASNTSTLNIDEGRDKKEDAEVVEMATRLAVELGIEQREISSQEIVERMIFKMINEGAVILEEGKAYRSSDCDLIYTNGYGFPVWRGGSMQYADEIGLDVISKTLEKLRQQLGKYGEM